MKNFPARARGNALQQKAMTHKWMGLPAILVAVAAASRLSAAAGLEPLRPPEETQTEHLLDKNYVVGEVRSAYVGETMLTVKDYDIQVRVQRESAVSSNDFTFKIKDYRIHRFEPVHGVRGEKYTLAGVTNFRGKEYRLIRLKGAMRKFDLFSPKAREEFLLPVDDNGRPSHEAEFYWQTGYPPEFRAREEGMDFTLVPVNTRFIVTSEESRTPVTGKAYNSYEIVYAGIDGESIKLTYREFAPDDPDTPAFFQGLSYDRADQHIRFRNIVISVLEAGNQQIKYVVESD